MDSLIQLIGKEQNLEKISVELTQIAMNVGAPVVGAHHVTCSDETERECLDIFSERFVQPLLPTLKLSQQSAFRTANLGARYEWGSVRIAEHHFATSETERAFKLMVIKINAHVSQDQLVDGSYSYGRMNRYNEDSDCCGALFALMKDNPLPAIVSIREAFEWEGVDRLGTLNDPDKIPENYKGLAAAIAQARLQSRIAMVDIRDHDPFTPTLFLVAPCVTINIPELDHEILCGLYVADYRKEKPVFAYTGLGDDPSKYQFEHTSDGLKVTEPDFEVKRTVRDHRKVPLERLTGTPEEEEGPQNVECEESGELSGILKEIAGKSEKEGAIRLFAEGFSPIHHVFLVDRLARDQGSAVDAKRVFQDVENEISSLDDKGKTIARKKLCKVLAQCRA